MHPENETEFAKHWGSSGLDGSQNATRDAGAGRADARRTVSHPHADAAWVERVCREIAAFVKTLRQTAEQLTPLQRWYRVLSRALVKYLNGRALQPPASLPAPA